MSPTKHQLRIMTGLAVTAFALTAAAGTLGVPVNGADPMNAPDRASALIAGTGSGPLENQPDSPIFEDPFD
jgi:hypothetical protein